LANYSDKRGSDGLWGPAPDVWDSFWNWPKTVRGLITLLTIIFFVPTINAQTDLQSILHEKAAFDEAKFAELQRGDPVVTSLPPQHKQEVAVYGLVRVQAPAKLFLESFRDTIATKSNPAILETGRFSAIPTIEDLKTLMMESGDIEDLKKCVVGNCQLKLSSQMIEQFQKIDEQSTDYAEKATQLYKLMLVDYVRDYLLRGDAALIEYADKPKTTSLLNGQRTLLASLPSFANESAENANLFSGKRWSPVESTIVWSKVKFGMKPVVAINHILIFKSEQDFGPEVVVLSKQIYANHYFDASVALTGLARNPSGNHEHYLFYENHTLADALQGLFSGIKRRLIEKEAINGLKNVLRETRVKVDARALNQNEHGRPSEASSTSSRLKIPRKQLLFLLFCITVLAMLALASYQRKANIPPGTHAS
jgi:hypothetical protein